MAKYSYPGYGDTSHGFLEPRPGSVGGYHAAEDLPRLSSRIPGIIPVGQNQFPRGAGAPPWLSDGTPSLPPARFPLEALLASDDNRAGNDWLSPLPIRSATSPTQGAPGGIPGLLAQIGAFDPFYPDQPPAGGLLRLIQEYMSNNPEDGN